MIIDSPLLVLLLAMTAFSLAAWLGAAIQKKQRNVSGESREDFGVEPGRVAVTR
jgi:hypothetical protein